MTDYSKLCEQTLCEISSLQEKPRLLLHACCAPCSSYVIEYLHNYFDITIFYYNPNITSFDEYNFRKEELCRLLREFPAAQGINLLDSPYEPEKFFTMAKGLESLPEGGQRCKECYLLRLEQTALAAKQNGFDYFATTLSISPYKNAEWLNLIGDDLSKKYGVKYLFSDFKKKNGYKRSIELSREYNLYRQNFCGCVFSQNETQTHTLEKNAEP